MKRTLIAAALLALGAAAPSYAAPVQWTAASGGNDHWYEVIWNVSGSISWTSANAAAQASTWDGESGYLATITSAAEQAFLNVLNHDFVSSPVHFGQYVSAWLGGTDAASEGTWGWANGDSWTYSNWNTYEPNDGIFSFLTEDYLVGWWSGDKWNDCGDDCLIQKYVVEYDAAPGEVPVPASLPLVLAGLGALGLVARRRKAA